LPIVSMTPFAVDAHQGRNPGERDGYKPREVSNCSASFAAIAAVRSC
jgi:hypothetical protein